MKAALFRKDGMGVVVGRLKSPNEIQYEDSGTIKSFHLKGNVVDTEFNDVFILGKRTGEIELEVSKMESLPKREDEVFYFHTAGDAGEVGAVAIPACKLSNIEERTGENGSVYHSMHFVLNEKTTMYLTVFGEIQKETANDCHVFVLRGSLKEEEHSFGSNYAVKKRIVKSGIGNQVLS